MSESLHIEAPRAVLERHGLRPKRSWGQNFLADRSVHERLVAEVVAGGCDRIVEIGAGVGSLTMRLATTGLPVTAIERDRDLARVLREELAHAWNVEVAEANALTFDYGAVTSGRTVIVGNLPYQIGTPVLLRVLACRPLAVRVVVMLQREVAERLVAVPGSPAYGALTLLVGIDALPRIAFRVPPGAFQPPPKVWSAVVVLTPSDRPRATITDRDRFRALVNAAFGKRRKTLWNALRGAGLAPDEPALRAAFIAAAIDPDRRGETLSLDEVAGLERALAAAGRD